jgi:drug/metabolite transporter (DMT)-like permease
MTERRLQLDFLAIALLLACCVFWGFQQVLVKATLPEVPPVLQASLRFMGATVLLWLWCRAPALRFLSRTVRSRLESSRDFCFALSLFVSMWVCNTPAHRD